MNLTTRFTEELVSLAKSYSGDGDEPAAPEGGDRFADYAMISLHGLRIFLEDTYEMIIDELEVMPPILDVIGLEADNLPHPSKLNKWLDHTLDKFSQENCLSCGLHSDLVSCLVSFDVPARAVTDRVDN